MYEYIKRTDAIKEINRGDLLVGDNAGWAREIIWRTPYADVAEVKHGCWRSIRIAFGSFSYTTFTCSECGYGVNKMTNYCSDCGARMDGESWYGRIFK